MMRIATTALLLSLGLAQSAAAVGAGCQNTTGPLTLEKVRATAVGSQAWGCLSTTFDILSASVPVLGSTAPQIVPHLIVSTIGARNATGIYVASYTVFGSSLNARYVANFGSSVTIASDLGLGIAGVRLFAAGTDLLIVVASPTIGGTLTVNKAATLQDTLSVNNSPITLTDLGNGTVLEGVILFNSGTAAGSGMTVTGRANDSGSTATDFSTLRLQSVTATDGSEKGAFRVYNMERGINNERFAVIGSSVLVGGAADTGVVNTKLEVNGDAQFGTGPTKSTVSTTGAWTSATGTLMTIDSGTVRGNFGVGTAAPTSRLTVDGTFNATGNSTIGGGLNVDGGPGLEVAYGIIASSLTADELVGSSLALNGQGGGGLRISTGATVANWISGWLSTSTAVNFGVLAGATCTDSGSITLNGAEDGDVVAVGAPDALSGIAGISVLARATAANTVVIRACCTTVTACSADAPTVNVKIYAWKNPLVP